MQSIMLTGGAGMGSTIIMLAIMIGVFYFMLIRPENKRKKEAEQMRTNVKVGDRITTIGGITGTVVNVKDDKFVIETGADQVRIEFLKWALSANDSANEAAQEAAKKAQEERAKKKAAKKAEKATVTSCRCHTVIPGDFDRAERTVSIKETGMCTLEITNLTGQNLSGIRVFYKHHEGTRDLYVGGITYSTVIPALEPGETRSVTPYRYASGYAQVVAVVPE